MGRDGGSKKKESIGKIRGGRTIKIHAVVDAHGKLADLDFQIVIADKVQIPFDKEQYQERHLGLLVKSKFES